MSMISVRTRAIARQRRAVASPAVAAALAQLAQAAGSFALQVVAAHALGARGLGVVSLCLRRGSSSWDGRDERAGR